MKRSTVLILAAVGHVASSVAMRMAGIEGAGLQSAAGVLLVGMGFICMEIEEAGRK
ncbi:hypothetical protein ACE3G8_04000 [Vreelandella venusta]